MNKEKRKKVEGEVEEEIRKMKSAAIGGDRTR